MLKYVTLIFCVLFSLTVCAMPKIGDPAPEAEVEEFSLNKMRGKVVVLYFYPKDNTANCTTEAKQFRDRIGEFEKLGVEVIGISNDKKDSHEKFRTKYNLPFKLISDADSILIKSYDVSGIIWTQRATFLIDRSGNIAYIWRSVNVEKHAQEVLDKIKELSL